MDEQATEQEEWREVKESSGVYEVSNAGRVRRSYTAPRCAASKPGRILKPDKHNSGYLRVTLRYGAQMHRVFVHRLVARAFLPEARRCAQVNHKDGKKHNNHVSNLEWCTPQENIRHAWDTGLCTHRYNEDANAAKLTNRDVIVIRAARQRGVPLREVASVFGVSESCISTVDRMETFKGVKPNG